ncbi:hypothetical protein [Legionella bozemanae]|uniref:Uncharacterized protein n=1 Tax=Legionella bozemanae TaxID=447 RepID=A0A0W0RXH5_LEGBO|nr:hypothetical protein [Legionella bozemanae]KTC75872.1 hypothetical protein Lboz_0700 [Legionella bozemanae]STO35505.1 Uncharacterised protein [Legionella bozemanae]
MDILEKFVQLVKTPLFSDNRFDSLDNLDTELKNLFAQDDQLKLREVISKNKQFADTVEVVEL